MELITTALSPSNRRFHRRQGRPLTLTYLVPAFRCEKETFSPLQTLGHIHVIEGTRVITPVGVAGP